MQKLIIYASILLLPQLGLAGDFNAGIGYNFIPDSGYASIGYKSGLLGVEGVVIRMGQEEPDTKPGPLFCFDGMLYIPKIPMFIKLGLEGGNGKNGYNAAIGVDISLWKHWSVRVQDTHFFNFKEDYGDSAENEDIVSAGLHYNF